MPAAAVIPALEAYANVAVVKTLVVSPWVWVCWRTHGTRGVFGLTDASRSQSDPRTVCPHARRSNCQRQEPLLHL